MKFRISRNETLKWPNKCVCCGGNPIMRYPVVGKRYAKYTLFCTLFGDIKSKSEKMVLEYPVCREHFFWSMGIQVAYLVSAVGLVLPSIMFVGALLFGFITIYWLLVLFFVATLILSNLLQPVRVKWVRKDSYMLIIRNEQYASEFAMLNGLSPT